MNVRDILLDPAAPPRPHAFVDAGAVAVLATTLVLFVAPTAYWALAATGSPPHRPDGFEVRALLWCAGLALLLPLVQIALQIRRFGGGAVRGNRARFRSDEGAAGRVARAHRNLIESLVPFAVAVLAAKALDVSTRWTAAAAALFLVARLVHAICYTLGITVIRSAAFYAGLIANAILLAQLLMPGV